MIVTKTIAFANQKGGSRYYDKTVRNETLLCRQDICKISGRMSKIVK